MRANDKHICVFDIETILDQETAEFFLEQSELDEAKTILKKRNIEHSPFKIAKTAMNIKYNPKNATEEERIKDVFLKPVFHQVVAISAIIAEITKDGFYEIKKIGSFGSSGSGEEKSEKSILSGFCEYLAKNANSVKEEKNYAPYSKSSPNQIRLISFNGRGFDIPVIKYRAMKHNISAQVISSTEGLKNYTYRYDLTKNTDLLEVLTDFNSSPRISLKELTSMLKIPSKTDMSGSDVSDFIEKKQFKEVEKYCEQDALITYIAFLRYRIMDGTINQSQFDDSIENLKEYLQNNLSESNAYLLETIVNKI